MKWYIEYLIFYLIIVAIVYMFTAPKDDMGARLFVSLIFGFILSAFAYAGYDSTKKKPTGETDEKTKKTNKKMKWIIIALVIFCIILFGIAAIVAFIH